MPFASRQFVGAKQQQDDEHDQQQLGTADALDESQEGFMARLDGRSQEK